MLLANNKANAYYQKHFCDSQSQVLGVKVFV